LRLIGSVTFLALLIVGCGVGRWLRFSTATPGHLHGRGTVTGLSGSGCIE